MLQEQARKLLMEEGLPVRVAAERLGCNRRWLYQLASRNCWPTNSPIAANSPRESAVLVALAKTGYYTDPEASLQAVAKSFRQAPANILDIIDRSKAQDATP